MVISHRHRYLFVELPRTGSTAIHRELIELYDGTAILQKHATYEDFLRGATEIEKTYRVFSTVRNPLDDAVSKYHKVKQGRAAGARPGGKDRPINRIVDTHMARYVRRTKADFASFFLRYYFLPFDTWASLSHDRFAAVMRFETLPEDFPRTLRLLGLQPVRPLPSANKTADRAADFASYYVQRTHARARRVFGPYMEHWGYAFPPEWGIEAPTRLHRLEYHLFSILAKIYWRHVRPRS